MSAVTVKPIAHIYTDFHDKFGVPRQSGIAEETVGKIVFEKEYSSPTAFVGLEGYSHLWLIWYFSLSDNHGSWSPTVRPPKLGGNRRVGVFATRSPNRPNPIGLSSVKILKIEHDTQDGTVIYVSGADIVNNTPIFDIKPYLPYTDSHPDAKSGFSQNKDEGRVNVNFDDTVFSCVPADTKAAIISVLQQDPRPSYKSGGDRVYKMDYSNYKVMFSFDNGQIQILQIIDLNDKR